MGLDSVELIMHVEKAFDIRIPDQEAEKIYTVGDLYACVGRHLQEKQSDKCSTQSLFYRLRQSFSDTFGFRFMPDTGLNDIFPKENRRITYLHFGSANNLELPGLVLTKTWSILLGSFGWATIAGGLGLSLVLINFFDYSKWTLLIPAAGIAMTIFFSKLLEPIRTVIKPAIAREFVKEVLTLNYASLIKDNGANRKEIEMVVNNIIIDVSGVEPHEIAPEKSLTDDLGIN